MTRTPILTVFFMLVTVTATQAQTKLERKYTEGEKYIQESYSKIEQTLSLAGMNIDTSAETNVTVNTEVGKRDGNGNLKVTETVASLNITSKMQGTEYQFDSANPDNKGNSPLEGIRGIHKALAKATTTTTFDATNKVASVVRKQDEVNALPAEVQALVSDEFDADTLKLRTEERLARVPSKAVRIGDTWSNTEVTSFGAGQTMTFEFEYSYEGTIDQDGKTLDKISRKATSVDFALAAGSPLPLTVKSSELKAEDLGSITLFDRQAGRVIEDKVALHVTGDLGFEINGMDLPAKLDLQLNTTLKTRPE